MNERLQARIFAKALHDLVLASEAAASISSDLQLLQRQWREMPQVRKLCLLHYGGSAIATDWIDELWQEALSPLSLRFLKLLARKRALALLPLIIQQYELLEDRALGRSRVKVEFACQPVEKQIAKVRQIIADAYGPLMELEVSVRPELIAGLRLYVNGKRVDASLLGRLNRLRTGILDAKI